MCSTVKHQHIIVFSPQTNESVVKMISGFAFMSFFVAVKRVAKQTAHSDTASAEHWSPNECSKDLLMLTCYT